MCLISYTVFFLLIAMSKSLHREYVVVKDNSANVPFKYKREANSDAPIIKEFLVTTKVANRFAETSVVSIVRNPDHDSKQTAFSVLLPERAFISGFYMKIDGNIYKAYVKDKEEARKIFGQSISTGETAGHVAVSTRNSNRFIVTINVEPGGKVLFRLDYEELLQRENGQYEIVTNIQPGQLVKKLRVVVNINESQPLDFVRTPILRSGSTSMDQHNTIVDPKANVTVKNTSAVIIFEPDIYRQLEFACEGLGNTENDGFSGQFIVKYDVVRNNEGGETIFQGGFFVNFFAPQKLDPLPKHIVFVLDTSGSMYYSIGQVKDAMKNILPQLNREDLFSIIQYESTVYVWGLNQEKIDIFVNRDPEYMSYGSLAEEFKAINIPSIPATEDNIETMKSVIDEFDAYGGTNSIGALEIGLLAIRRIQEQYPNKYLPILVFLTDGQPNVGSGDPNYIVEKTTELNKANFDASIYSLSFGNNVDWNFLSKLSLKNHGAPTMIPVDKDSSTYLQDFYKRISVPLLSNVSFQNLPQTGVTQTNFKIYFNGSELVIAGKGNETKPISVVAKGKQGPMEFVAQLGIPLTRLEKVWAYLTVKHLTEQYHATGNTNLSTFALDLAKNYSLVSEFTSLVVVKPESEEENFIEDGSIGIFPKTLDELPMCRNKTDFIEKNYGSTEPDDEFLTSTTSINEYTAIIESDFGVTMSTNIPTVITTTTEPTTTTIQTTTVELTCEYSTYGCCYDNITFSLRPNADGCDPIPNTESCSLLQDKGTCTNFTAKWFYSIKHHRCRQFRYGGCGGNDNRFVSQQICENTCIHPNGSEKCKLPISLGACKKNILHWFYNKSKGECEKYLYGGCFGNSNRFDTKEDCLKLCNPPMLKKTQEDACFQPEDRGYQFCSNHAIHYYFDTLIGECRKFWYSGCGGNDNRFKTKGSCESLCVYSKNKAMCRSPPVKGPCNRDYNAWFFDIKTETCQSFIYGGCGGNKNKFLTEEECKKTCLYHDTNVKMYK